MNNTEDKLEQEKYELRIISSEIERMEAVEALKVKHRISGTLAEQKATVEMKMARVETKISDNAKGEYENDTDSKPTEEEGKA